MEYKLDQDILRGIRIGEDKAFGHCYAKFLPIIRGWFLKNGGEKETADDLFQEALLVLYDKSQSSDFQLTVKLSTYLLSICKFQWFNQLRDKKEIAFEEDADDWLLADVENDIIEHQLIDKKFDVLEKSFSKLGEPCSTILKSYYFENLSMQEISIKLDYTNANNAKVQKHKCLQRLKKIINLNS